MNEKTILKKKKNLYKLWTGLSGVTLSNDNMSIEKQQEIKKAKDDAYYRYLFYCDMYDALQKTKGVKK